MDVLDAIRNRQSYRAFEPRMPPRETLDELIAAARWAPSSCNLQLTEYVIVDDAATIDRLAKRVNGKFRWGGAYIVFLYDPRFTVKRHAAVTSLGAAMQNILLTAHANGLGACPMAGFERDAALRDILRIPPPYEIALIMAVGYPTEQGMKDRFRLPLERVRHWNAWRETGNRLNDATDPERWSFADIVNYRERMAPVYCYNTRFGLHTFADAVYASVAALPALAGRIAGSGSMLDILTYDAHFLRAMLMGTYRGEMSASDVIPFTLSVVRKNHPSVKTLLLTEEGSITGDGRYDLVTCVHKIEFTPRYERLLAAAAAKVAPGGALLVSTSDDPWFKRAARAVRAWKLRSQGETVNVYEHSPFYKIGPYARRPLADVVRTLEASGLRVSARGTARVKGSGRFGPHRYGWVLAERAQS